MKSQVHASSQLVPWVESKLLFGLGTSSCRANITWTIKYTHSEWRSFLSIRTLLLGLRSTLRILSKSFLFLHEASSSGADCQRYPSTDQAQSSKRRHGSEKLETLRIQYQQVYRAAEHGHACGQKASGESVLGCRDGCDEEDGGVHELSC